MTYLFLASNPFFTMVISEAVIFLSRWLFSPIRNDGTNDGNSEEPTSFSRGKLIFYIVLYFFWSLPEITVLVSSGISLNSTLTNSWIFHHADERDEARSKVEISYFKTIKFPYLPGIFQPKLWHGLTAEFVKAGGNKILTIYAEILDHPHEGFSLKRTPGLLLGNHSILDQCDISASPSEVISKVEELTSAADGENWSRQLFDLLQTSFGVHNHAGEIPAPEGRENVQGHQMQCLVKLFKKHKMIKNNIAINSAEHVNDFLTTISDAFQNKQHFEMKRTVFLYLIEYEDREQSKRWGVMLRLLSGQGKSEEYYVIKTPCAVELLNETAVQGFSISHWDGDDPGGYQRKYPIRITESFSACSLIERYATKYITEKPSSRDNNSLIEFSFKYFDSLRPAIDPSLTHFEGEYVDDSKMDVTVYFYDEILSASSSLPPYLYKFTPQLIAKLFGYPVRHWGIGFQFHDVINIPERLRYITISGDRPHLSFERGFIVRLHFGRPDENEIRERGFLDENMGTTQLSFKQILDCSLEILDESDVAGKFAISYNLLYVNCHEWARALYGLIAEKHKLPSLKYRLTACHLLYVINAIFILIRILVDYCF